MRKAHALPFLLTIVIGGSSWAFAQGGMLTAQNYVEIQQLYARYNMALQETSDVSRSTCRAGFGPTATATDATVS
jgi:hypothetical protein